MMRRGWKEFRALGCRKRMLILYDLLWVLGFRMSAATVLYNELHVHCGISHETISKALGVKLK